MTKTLIGSALALGALAAGLATSGAPSFYEESREWRWTPLPPSKRKANPKKKAARKRQRKARAITRNQP